MKDTMDKLIYSLSIMAEVLKYESIDKVVFVTDDGTELPIDSGPLVDMIVVDTANSLKGVANILENETS